MVLFDSIPSLDADKEPLDYLYIFTILYCFHFSLQ